MEKFRSPFAQSADLGNKSKTRKLKLYGHFRWYFMASTEEQRTYFRFGAVMNLSPKLVNFIDVIRNPEYIYI